MMESLYENSQGLLAVNYYSKNTPSYIDVRLDFKYVSANRVGNEENYICKKVFPKIVIPEKQAKFLKKNP